ncbi:hypothetical protein Syun_007147 [Stephania yunnanensis]|uniref:Uncharacterized protein n=1 Tax=Stephania yunnanensis TaxID=152371 RepID=A0AAP0KY39_9MAGN
MLGSGMCYGKLGLDKEYFSQLGVNDGRIFGASTLDRDRPFMGGFLIEDIRMFEKVSKTSAAHDPRNPIMVPEPPPPLVAVLETKAVCLGPLPLVAVHPTVVRCFSSLPWNALRSSLPRPSAAAGCATPLSFAALHRVCLGRLPPLAVRPPPQFVGIRRCSGTIFVAASETIVVALCHHCLCSPRRWSSWPRQPSPLARPFVAAACVTTAAGRRCLSLPGHCRSLKRTYKMWNASLEWLRAGIGYELRAFEDKVQRRHQELTQTTPDQPVDDEAVYYKVAGECPKGRVYGLGSLGRKKRRYVDGDASTSPVLAQRGMGNFMILSTPKELLEGVQVMEQILLLFLV